MGHRVFAKHLVAAEGTEHASMFGGSGGQLGRVLSDSSFVGIIGLMAISSMVGDWRNSSASARSARKMLAVCQCVEIY